ncbi:MAG: MBL fold metallo-hydrolase, partial [Planctomycetota bacterium]
MHKEHSGSHPQKTQRRRLPRSFKELTPCHHFSPRKFFYELIWKAFLTRRVGQRKLPKFPKLTCGQLALTWIGHASFLAQFTDLNVLIDPNFANWLFFLKRIRRAGMKIQDLPPIDLVLLTHAHFDHLHRPTLRRLRSPKIAVVPWGVGDPQHPNLSPTYWRSVADSTNKIYYFESALSPNIVWVNLNNINFNPGSGVRAVAVEENYSIIGNIDSAL